jgi:hypothetical protein
LETFEEHDIIQDSTVFYTHKQRSESRSRSQRRAVSVGPGLGHEDIDEDLETVGVPGEGEAEENWTSIERGRDRIPRSASALPGTHDGSTWHRDGFSRRSSYNGDSPGLGPPPGLEALSIAERGPSPAYTAESRPIRSNGSSRRSSLRLNSNGTNPSRGPDLSPIASAAPSRAPSDRTDSTSTERRFAKSPQTSADEIRHLPGVLEGSEPEAGPSRPSPRPILDSGSRRTSSNVRFDETPQPLVNPTVIDSDPEERDELAHLESMIEESRNHQSGRAASIRTNHSAESGSNTSTHQSTYHPTSDAVQAISTVSTPAPSRPASTHARSSTEEPSQPSTLSSGSSGPTGSRRSSTALRDGRLSGLASATSSAVPSPTGSRADLTQVRVGRSNRNGSATTIVTNLEEDSNDAQLPVVAPLDQTTRRSSGSVRPGPSRLAPKRRESSEDRGRKFSFTAALRGLSQDVKDKVRGSSRSRTRGKSRTDSFSNAPPLPAGAAAYASSSMSSRSGSAIPPRLVDDGFRNGRAVSREVTPPGDFVPPFGAGGAGRARSGSRDRNASPTSRSQSRGRGRNMGMKALTGKFTIGEEGDEADEDNEPVHNWKEFRKGESRH